MGGRDPRSVSWSVPPHKVCLKLHSWRTLNLIITLFKKHSSLITFLLLIIQNSRLAPVQTCVPQNTQIIWNRWTTVIAKTRHTVHTCSTDSLALARTCSLALAPLTHSHSLALARLHLLALAPLTRSHWLARTCSTDSLALARTCSHLLHWLVHTCSLALAHTCSTDSLALACLLHWLTYTCLLAPLTRSHLLHLTHSHSLAPLTRSHWLARTCLLAPLTPRTCLLALAQTHFYWFKFCKPLVS